MNNYFYFEIPEGMLAVSYNGPCGTGTSQGPFLVRAAFPPDSYQSLYPEKKEVEAGQRLFFMDRRSGTVRSGRVKQVEQKKFYFWFDDRRLWFDKSVICRRLFFTREDAARFGKAS